MRALVQRVSAATVTVEDEPITTIGAGLCAFIGVTHTDDADAAARLARRLWGLRIFDDGDGRINTGRFRTAMQVALVNEGPFTVSLEA